MGMSASRSLSFDALSEIASLGRTCSRASRSIPGTIPLVESVTCFGESPSPPGSSRIRSEEHTSELQSRLHLVCRLLLEKKKAKPTHAHTSKHTDRNTPNRLEYTHLLFYPILNASLPLCNAHTD